MSTMNNPEQIKAALILFAMHLPTLLVCVVAVAFILTRLPLDSAAAQWALPAFALALILCFVVPIGQTLLQFWVFQGGGQAGRMWAFQVFSVVLSLLHALIYALLLSAVLAGRSRSDAVKMERNS